MSKTSIDQTLQQGIAHHQAGRLAEAEALYRQILATFPNHADALHLLGVIAGQANQHQAATELFQKAISISPRNADYHRNLAFSLQNQGHLEQASKSFQQVTALTPYNPDAHFYLANARWTLGDFQGAVDSYQRVVTLNPRHADAQSNMGSALLQLGRHDQAVASYQNAIALQPGFLQAHHNLVTALVQLGRFDEAVSSCQRALTFNPRDAELYNLLGNAFKDKADFDQAIASYQQALSIQPTYAEVHNNLGNVYREQKKLDQALVCYRQALELSPQNGEFHFSLGAALQDGKKWDQAIESYQKALELQPSDGKIYHNLGSAWSEKKDYDQAIAAMRKAVEFKPDFAESWLNLGMYLWKKGTNSQALVCLDRAIALKPDYVQAYDNRGVIFNEIGLLDQAISDHQQALQLNPKNIEALVNLGNAWKEKGVNDRAALCFEQAMNREGDHRPALISLANILKEAGESDRAMERFEKALALKEADADLLPALAGLHLQNGDLEQAIQCYRKAIELDPSLYSVHDALVFVLLYEPGTTPHSHLHESKAWHLLHTDRLAERAKPLSNNRDPNRQLRVGYISPDFREHVVARFLLPLFSSHDKSAIEFYCYADVKKVDAISTQIQSHAAGWRSIVGIDDEAVAEMIRDDKIDILVDLVGHTGGSRLKVLAQKPAPVQATYLGYPGTTGVPAVDYRITDFLADPPGMTEPFHTETIARLDPTAWCYQPSPDALPVSESPAKIAGYVTFCSFNNFAKVNDVSLGWWMRILHAVPTARLVIKSKGVSQSFPRNKITKIMDQHSIDPNRVELRDWVASSDHYTMFSRVDIALDSFPYNGTTTTCESLWMGVPVITLAGKTHVSRVGVSLLTNVGLPKLIADTPEQYAELAIGLATDLPRLANIRSTLRQRMQNSPLTDGPRFARSMEKLYRTMWRSWCAENNSITGNA